jgi:hypothetical protein
MNVLPCQDAELKAEKCGGKPSKNAEKLGGKRYARAKIMRVTTVKDCAGEVMRKNSYF